MRGGTIFWLGVALLCLAAIALMCFRPARVVGVSDEALAYSLRGAADGLYTGECREDGDRWTCRVPGPSSDRGSSNSVGIYRADVDDWGCWEAERRRPKRDETLPESLDGCITIIDLIRLGD